MLCYTKLYVVHTLHKAVKPGKANAWPFEKAQHITIMSKDMETFVKKHSLGYVSTGETPAGRWMHVEIWDLVVEKFTSFDAYGDGQHYGTMWTNPNGNIIGAVGPAVRNSALEAEVEDR
jgi:hypothetical protein